MTRVLPTKLIKVTLDGMSLTHITPYMTVILSKASVMQTERVGLDQ